MLRRPWSGVCCRRAGTRSLGRRRGSHSETTAKQLQLGAARLIWLRSRAGCWPAKAKEAQEAALDPNSSS